jgi:ribose 5-phosphate isomerase RpiB
MRIVFGTDEDTLLTDAVVAELAQRGHDVERVAPGEAWPEVGRAVGEAVADGRADRGVVCCWTGTGVSIDGHTRVVPQPVRITATGFGIGMGSSVSTAS